AANVRGCTAGEHPIRRGAKSSWRVDARAGEVFTVTYRYYAGVLDAGSSFLDDDEVYINGSNLFMLVDGLRSEEHRLTIAAPAEWRIESQLQYAVILSREDGEGPPAGSASSVLSPGVLRSAQDDTNYVARDYDYLIDSPIIAAATMTRHTFDEAGAWFIMIYCVDRGFDREHKIETTRLLCLTKEAHF